MSELSRDCLSNPLAPTGPNPGAQPTPPAPRSGEAQSAFPPAPAKRSWVRALSLEGVGVGSPPGSGYPSRAISRARTGWRGWGARNPFALSPRPKVPPPRMAGGLPAGRVPPTIVV